MPETNQPDSGDNRSQHAGFPSGLIARVVKADIPLTIDGLDSDGDFTFSVSLAALKLSRSTMNRTPMAWSTFFVDLLGGVLVHKYIGLFADHLAQLEPTAYLRLVNAFGHRNFGMTIDDDGTLRFRFHASLVQKILTDDLDKMFDTETTDASDGKNS